VERWAEWTESIECIVALDGPGLDVGKRFEIEQPRLPRLVWGVIAVEPGSSWTWRHRSAGSTTLATHEVLPRGDGRTLVRQRIDQRGPVGVAVGVLMLRLTKRYLENGGPGAQGAKRATALTGLARRAQTDPHP
jgi:hypothetical protein